MSTHLAAVTLLVPDLRAARRFYCDVLGFAVEQEFGSDLVQLKHAACALLLSRCEQASAPAYPTTAQIALGIAVPDLDAELRRLRALEVPFVIDTPQEFPAGRFFAVRDPGGNVIEVLEFHR
jgi:lactoylglutathione lyase